jgi:hypothetical protein
MSVKQAQAKFVLEHGYLPTKGWLGSSQSVRRQAQLTELRNVQKRA